MIQMPYQIRKVDYDKLSSKKCSIVLCTFREKPKFELLYESLSHQTIKNFEIVIADFLYEKRIDYVQELAKKYGITTVHVERDKYGVKAFNVGIANSRGDYMIHINDANYFPYRFVEKHMMVMMNNFLSVGARYFNYGVDFPIEKHLTAQLEVPDKQDEKIRQEINKLSNGISDYLHLNFGEHRLVSPQDFRLLGLPKQYILTDNLLMEGPGGWTYGGNIGGPTELFLKINGFDERFDQGYGWSDCNLGIRAANTGHKLFMNPSNWTLEIHDDDHDSVFNILPEYEEKKSSKYNWKLYEEACEKRITAVNPHINLRAIREENLKRLEA